MNIKIYPSLISSNLLDLEKTITELSPYCDGFHLDVMDNHFVPNLTMGPDFVNQIAEHTDKQLAVHLMVEQPLTIIERLKMNRNAIIAVHVETDFSKTVIEKIKARGWLVSIAINPSTPLERIYQWAAQVDQILLMSVQPGFSGQQFIPESVGRLQKLVNYKKEHSLRFEIAMDGGINSHNIAQLVSIGCTSFCVASAIFNAANPALALKKLSEAVF